MARKLEVIIAGDSRGLERSFASANRSIRGFSVGLGSLAKSAAVIGGVTAAAAGVGSAVRTAFSEFSDASKVAAQTAAEIKATGGIANVTAKQVDALATAVENYSGIDDEAIKAGENMILTFKNVRNEVGKGNQIFDRATKAAVDLSVAGFGAITDTAKQLAKALNDPIRGITALNRSGVTFTEGQREQIKALVETGKTLEAQKIILREVESQVSGSARAFGETLPGQLSKLRESFKNTLGDLVGSVAPALSGALGEFNDFLDDLGQARTVGAKIRVTLDRVEGLATALTKRVGDAVAAIDWNQIWRRARGVADGLQRQLERVDFSVVGKRIGDAFSDAAKVALPAAKDLAQRIADAVDAIDWEKLGRAMGPGLASAVATAFVTLTDPGFWARNWDLALAVAAAVFPARIGAIAARIGGEFAAVVARALERVGPEIAQSFRGLAVAAVQRFAEGFAQLSKVLAPLERIVVGLFGRLGKAAVFVVKVLGIQAAIQAVAGFARTVGRVFAGIGQAIGHAFEQGFDFIVKKAIEAALAIVEPFSHVPKKLGGGVFQDLKASLKAQLDGMAKEAGDTAAKVNSSLASIKDRTVTLGVNVAINGKTQQEGGTGAAGDPGKSIAGAISGALDFFQGAIDKANKAAKQAGDAAAKSVATGAENAKKAAAAAKKAATEQRKAFDSLIDSLALKVDRAAATKGFAGDLKANTELQAAIRRQIAVEGNTTELASQLFQAQQARSAILAQQAQAAADARAKAAAKIQAAQFKALGLTGQGEARTPGVANLRKQLEQLTARLGADVSPKIAAQLAGVGKVLSGTLGKVTEETRQKILELFQTIRGTFDQQAKGPLTKTTSLNTSKIVEGLGLGPEATKALRARLSGFNSAGVALARPSGVAAFGQVVPSSQPVVVNSTIELDGRVVARNTTRHQQKKARRNPPQKRGPTVGGRF